MSSKEDNPDSSIAQRQQNRTERNKNKTEKTEETKGKEKSEIQVHSANSWETADLGDKGRNEKFLRLMGAAKKEHHGKFVIGDQTAAHARPKKDEAQVNEGLVEQYEQSMEHRLAGGRKGHLGLGFHAEESEKDGETAEKDQDDGKEEGDDATQEKEDGDDTTQEKANKTDDEKAREKDERRRESSDRKREGSSESPYDVKKLKFVKGSS